MDTEDILQEVFKGILTRNKGRCPWDPQKSSFGHYVHMVCGCVLLNLQKKQKRRGEKEIIGVRKFSNNMWQWQDAAESFESSYEISREQEEFEIEESMEDLRIWLEGREDSRKTDNRIARKIIPLLCQGYKRSEIANSLGMDPGKVSRGLHYLRSVTSEWAEF
jgi:DNA-directed RNA polymerase specialized sigma24 family protein